MRYLATAALALTTIFSTMAATASDADARRWHRNHGGAIALGIAGAVIGGIALSNRHRYYDNYYYDDYPYYTRPARSYYYGRSYYGRPYYGGRSYYRGVYGHRHYDRRGRGGSAWGMRGKGWSSNRRYR
jgi:hypothetical protein